MAKSTIQIRPIEIIDYPALEQMICETWHFNAYCRKASVLHHMNMAFLYDSLLRQNFSAVAQCEGQIAGVLLGRCDRAEKNIPSLRNRLGRLWHGLCMYLHKDGRDTLRIIEHIGHTDDLLLSRIDKVFEGELVLFITNSNFRGQGIGKALLNHYFDFMRQNGASHFYIFTDTQCNVGFYESHGFHRLAAEPYDIVTYQSIMKTIFYLYEYTIK